VSPGGVSICGIGIVSAAGGTALQTATTVRAGINMYAPRNAKGEGEPVVMALLPDEWLPPLHAQLAVPSTPDREARLLRLAAPALGECLSNLPGLRPPPLFLALPEPPPGLSPLAGDRFLDLLAVQAPGGFDRARSHAFAGGRAAGFAALHTSLHEIAAGSDYAIVGGIDTYLDPEVLTTLELEGRLIAEGATDAFAPGEAAGFLLLGSAAAVERDGLSSIGFVHQPAAGVEPGHRYSDEPYRGEGLAAAVAAAIASGPGVPVRTVLCSLNGESLGAKEWGVAALRSRPGFADDVRMFHPADCFGDAGAATAPMLIGLAAIGMQRGYLEPPSLVWCSSEAELRGAACVSTGPGR
jgi:3-oxoacyl-[acyl-carrier-protein] synthase I